MLWEPGLRPQLAYRPRWALNTGFSTGSVTMAALESGQTEQRPGIDAPALVAYARAIGLKAGDIQTIVLSGPSGQVLAKHQAEPLVRHQAQSLIFAGFRKPPAGWSQGTYRAKYLISHDGSTVFERDFEILLP